MFGKNPSLKFRGDEPGDFLQVVKGSPFYTIQGEGPFSGRPAVFIRLHGCHLKCTFCDTEFSDSTDPVWKVEDLAKAALDLIPASWPKYRQPIIVITGGEPARQPLKRLVELIQDNDNPNAPIIQVETSGSFYQDVFSRVGVFLVVSPKTPYVHPSVARLAHAWKYIIKATDPLGEDDGLPTTVHQPSGDPRPLYRPPSPIQNRVYLSPCDEYDQEKNKANKQKVAELCMQYGYQAGVQLHKELYVP